MKGRIKKILYICSVVVLLFLGFYIWKMNVGIYEGQTFTVEGDQEATFIMETKLEHPRMIAVRVDGEMEGNGTLVLKGHGREEDVREWNDALSYLTNAPPETTAQATKERLIHLLSQPCNPGMDKAHKC